MFLRFTGHETDFRTGKKKGIFTLAYDLIESSTLLAYEEAYLKEILSWFGETLPVPGKFSQNRNNHHKETFSTSWFKDSAGELLEKVWELKHILESKDVLVEVRRSEKPGYTLYEDDYQIVVRPF